MFLTTTELIDLTGYKRASFQLRWLRESGFKCSVAGNGRINVLKSHIYVVMGGDGGRIKTDETPDAEALLRLIND